MRIALATHAALPSLDADDAHLVEALRARGLQPEPVIWDAPAVDWSRYAVVLVRSTWDYHRHRPRFLAWAERVDATTTLVNPLGTIRWSSHKRYLRDLASRGIDVVPTVWLEAKGRADLRALLDAHGWDRAVLKPAVSAGAERTIAVDRARLSAAGAVDAQAHLDALLATGDAMLQPYVRDVEGYGERSLVFFDGHFSHAVRKRPALGPDAWRAARGPSSDALGPDATDVVTPTDEELAFAASVLHACAAFVAPPTYARVDLAPSLGGTGAAAGARRTGAGVAPRGAVPGAAEPPLRPMLMELELVEPSLFFAAAPSAADRLAAPLARLAEAASKRGT